ncbi:hypothetical protein INT44_000453 [Umbelopsis vinacea]|uniref:PEBP-like protein n=1 Tax=Umbelopsis vinacea TaxID=44442 RepID=A0A8H7PLK4_9FUNG|nr:hypothetical protein INT44_000453 [Umbelopsis vinacea]
MPTFGERFEAYLGYLLSSQKGRDAGLMTHLPPFDKIKPTINVSSEIGASGCSMPKQCAMDGDNEWPGLTWEKVPDAQEYIVVAEDADVPIPNPIAHGFFYGIPAEVTSIQHADLKEIDTTKHTIKNGSIKYGKTMLKTVYEGPKPVYNHGPHRYYYTVVALKQPLENVPEYPSKTQLVKAVNEDNVLAWGEWIGVYERKLE